MADWESLDALEQSRQGNIQKGVSGAMMQGGGPLRRAWAGAKAWKEERSKSPWLDRSTEVKQDVISKNISALFRLTGRTKQAEWIDRFTVTQRKKEEKEAKKEQKKEAKVVDTTKREMSTVRGSLIRIERDISILNAAVLDTRDDVGDIKKMLMPTNLVASGEGERYGEEQFVQYNPLAPKGAQFLKQQSLEIDGEPVRGKLINRAPDEEFMESAIRMAAVETASTVLRVQRKDEERKNRTEARLSRRRTNLANDTWAYSDPTEPDRDFMRKLTGEWGGKAEEVDEEGLLDDIAEGVIGGAIGATAPGLIKGIFTKLLGAGGAVASMFGPAIAAAAPLAFMGLFTKWADEADINNPGSNPLAVLGAWALKKSQEWAGWSLEEHRAQRKAFEDEAMEKARKGEMPLDVAQSMQSHGRRAPGAFTPWNAGEANITPTAEQLEIYTREAKKFRDMAAAETDEAKRRQHEAAAAAFESMIPNTPTGELRPAEQPENMKDLITKAANMVGMDAATMIAIARQESGFQPNAQPYDKDGKPLSSAKGLFQFITSTWNAMKRRYGSDFSELEKGPMDPYANSLAAALLAKEHSEALLAKGIQPTPRNLYALHMMGDEKGKQLLNADPNDIAADLFPNEAASNVGMFYTNGRAVTVKELLQKMYDKVGAKYYHDKYTLEQRFGRDYSSAFMPQRFNGTDMDNTSREVQYAQRTESGGNAPSGGGLAVVNNTLPIRGTPPVTTAPTPPGYTSDPSILLASGRDS